MADLRWSSLAFPAASWNGEWLPRVESRQPGTRAKVRVHRMRRRSLVRTAVPDHMQQRSTLQARPLVTHHHRRGIGSRAAAPGHALVQAYRHQRQAPPAGLSITRLARS